MKCLRQGVCRNTLKMSPADFLIPLFIVAARTGCFSPTAFLNPHWEHIAFHLTHSSVVHAAACQAEYPVRFYTSLINSSTLLYSLITPPPVLIIFLICSSSLSARAAKADKSSASKPSINSIFSSPKSVHTRFSSS